MELLYYWIDKEYTYKKLGVTLSNRYLFETTSEENKHEVTITPNDKYIENFFGNHIVNLTAVIGENGAGKTNLLYSLIARFARYQYRFGTSYFLCFLKENRLVIYESISQNSKVDSLKINSNIPFEVIKLEKTRRFSGEPDLNSILSNDTKIIYYNPLYDFRDYPFNIEDRGFSDVSSTHMFWWDNQNRNKGDYDMMAIHKSQEVLRQFRMTQSPFLKDIKEVDEISFPDQIVVEVLRTDRIEETDLGYESKVLYNFFRKYGSIVFGPHNTELENSKNSHKALKHKAKTWLLVNFIDHFFHCYAFKKDLDDKILGVRREDFEFFNQNKEILTGDTSWNDWPSMKPQEYHSILFDFFQKQRLILSSKYNIVEHLTDLFEIIDKFSTVEEQNKAVFILPFESAFQFLGICDRYVQSFENKYVQGFVRVNWRNMSSGELGFLNLFARIFSGYHSLMNENTPVEDTPKTIYLMIDEGDHGFHPHWQKVFVQTLINFLKYFQGIKFQVFLTSHSPIMLSDIPRQNVVFLQKGEGVTRVVSSVDKKETFGANIHQLFRDSFFIKDGVIGGFARSKIKEIVESVNNLVSSADIEGVDTLMNQIDLIGEPILRETLKQEVMGKKANALKIRYHESEIERLKKTND